MFPGLNQLAVPLLIVVSGFVCLEFTFPVAIGEFIAGMIGGHFVDVRAVTWLKFFSYLGLLCLMFLAGFEVDLKILKKNFKKSLIIGFSSFFTPYLAVLIVGFILGFQLKVSLVVATALSTTSLAMIFTILKGADLIQTNHGQILLGSAMVVDLLSMLSLTLIFFDFSIYNFIYVAVLIVAVVFIERIVVSIFKRYKGNRFEFELKFLLLILLGLGIISEGAGIHAAIIAFIVGIIFSDMEKQHIAILEKLDTVVFSLLAPIFFFHAGSLISLGRMNAQTWMLFSLFLLIAVVGKFFGSYFGLYYLYHKDTAVARFGGIVFNYRLSFGIVTGMYAYDAGLITIELLNIIFLIVALSSVISVFLEKKLEKEVCIVKAPKDVKPPEVKPF